MLRRANFLFLTFIVARTPSLAAQNGQTPTLAAKLLSAKSAYFEAKTLLTGAARKALAELTKWGGFKVVTNSKDADLIFLLSSGPHKGGYVFYPGGQTGEMDNSENIEEGPLQP
ncbi:MAG TPA: hypothetical protein VF740_11480 [Candidatus Acidoferrum sp.]